MEEMVFISHSSADKAVANTICHRLEETGIRCWIAPRDITNSDWAGSIMDGLRRSEVFVVVISHNSIPSPEVAKEVTEATHTCRYILPFKVDDEMLNDRLQYHLGPCHWLDAVSPPMEQRIDELKERILNLSGEDAVYLNQNQWKLQQKILWPRGLFVGREEEIDTIAGMLEEEHVLFLQGMGGIGKSEIAKGYAKACQDRYDTIVFASYTSNLLDLVTSDEIPIENLRRGTDESQEDFFKRKLQVLKDLSTDRTLLIVDNFDVDWDERLEELITGPYHLLVTTRNEHSAYPTLSVGKIKNFAKVRQIFTTNYGRSLPAAEMETVDEILRLVGCHTITVELIAKQMKASFQKPGKMLELLRGTGTNTHLKEKVKREGKEIKRTSFDFIRELFQLSGLSEDERHILCCMCMVPYSGINVPQFGEYCGLEDFDAVNSLLSKSWLMLDEETDFLMLHPVICDVVRDQLAPTPLSCKAYVMGLWEHAKDCWFYTVEERDTIAPYVAFIQRTYPQPVPELWLQYGDFVNVAWICGNFKLSQRSGHVFYQFCLDHFGPDSVESGNAATWLAGAYHNGGDNESAEPYYKLGLEHRLACMDPNCVEVAVSYTKVGRCAFFRGDYDEARIWYAKADAAFRYILEHHTFDPNQKYPGNYGDFIVELERLHMAEGDYEKALELCQYSYDIFYSVHNKEITNSEYSLVDMGMCYSALGDYAKAEEYLNRALELNIAMNGEASVQTVRTREALADNCLRRGDREQAGKLYLKLEMDLERDFGSDNPQVRQLREKRERMEEGGSAT